MTKMENENTTPSVATPISFWVIASLILIWGLLGVIHFLDFMTTTVERLVSQGMTIEQAEFFLNAPSYFVVLFGLGVWSGLLGAVLLILRKAWAAPAFLFSAVITVVSFVSDAIYGSFSVLGAIYMLVVIFTLAVALFEAWYSRRMKARGILQ